MQWLNDRIKKRPKPWCCHRAMMQQCLKNILSSPSGGLHTWSFNSFFEKFIIKMGGGGLSSFCAWLQTVSSKLKPTGGSEDFTSSSLHDYPMLRIGFQPQPNVSNTKSNLINLNELDASGRWQVKGYASKTWNDHSKYLDSHQSSKLIWWDKEKR